MFTPEVINNIVLAIIAIANAITAYMAYHNHTAIAAVREDVKTVELATNSMKDALVKSAGELGMAQGFEAGRLSGQTTRGDRQAALRPPDDTKKGD